MAIRDRWTRMMHKSASSATTATSTTLSGSYPSSAPTSPSIWMSVTGFNWSTSKGSSGYTDGQQHQQQSPAPPSPPPQHQHGEHQQPQMVLPERPKPKRRSKKSSSSYHSYTRIHPSERPLTDENLRHQEMFAGYRLTFGSSSSSSRCSFDGEVSPCSSRRASLDYARAPPTTAFSVVS